MLGTQTYSFHSLRQALPKPSLYILAYSALTLSEQTAHTVREELTVVRRTKQHALQHWSEGPLQTAR